MTDEQILDLWGQASKNVGVKNPRHFDELREFAQLIEERIHKNMRNHMLDMLFPLDKEES